MLRDRRVDPWRLPALVAASIVPSMRAGTSAAVDFGSDEKKLRVFLMT
jgi:hypothetical protein